MAAKLWFSPKTVRRIKLRSYAGLVGKAPTKEKRIKMLCTMPITGQKMTGFPDWLADGRDFTMKTGETVKCSQVIPYCNVTMSDEQSLFQKTPVEAPKARLSHFSIENEGESEDPTTVVKFQMLAPFSTDLLRWCGAMAGEEFDSSYELTEAPADQADEDDEEDSDDDALADSEDADEEEDDDSPKAQARRRTAKAANGATPPPTAAEVARAKENLKLM